MEETFEFERDGRKFVVEAKRFFDEWLGKEKVTADIFEVTEPGSKKLRAQINCGKRGPVFEAEKAIHLFLILEHTSFGPALTFEALLEKVRESKPLFLERAFYTEHQMRECYSDGDYCFEWQLLHPGKGYENESRQIILSFCEGYSNKNRKLLEATPAQLLQFREALCLKAVFDWEEEEEEEEEEED